MTEPVIELWVYAEGRDSVFGVSISDRSDVDDLRREIFNRAPTAFVGCDDVNIKLVKVRYIMTPK